MAQAYQQPPPLTPAKNCASRVVRGWDPCRTKSMIVVMVLFVLWAGIYFSWLLK